MPRRMNAAEPVPHSWDMEHWPEKVYPHSALRARYVLRAHRHELLAAGALSRVGRELIVLGERYCRWLEKRAADVPGYETPMNREPSAAMADPLENPDAA